MTRHLPNIYTVGNAVIKPRAFVDDVGVGDGSADAARETGECLTSALDQLGLKAHPTKSVNMISGSAAKRSKGIQSERPSPRDTWGWNSQRRVPDTS